MRMHPRERGGDLPGLSRRQFLRKGVEGAAAVSGLAALLAACGPASNPGGGGAVAKTPTASAGASGLLLARPDHPVRWPIDPDNQPIASGLTPERNATLKIYNWADYLYGKVVKDFARHYDCKVEISTFNGVDEALAKLRTGQVDFDVYFPDPSFLGRLVLGKLLRPLNLDYIPNLSNVWPSLQDPFYDRGSRYTVPYTVYTTGIGWRNDHVTEDVASMSNPYDIYWDSKYRGKIHLIDDFRETLGMTMVRRGLTDTNTEDPAVIDRARADLTQLIGLVNVKVDVNEYSDLPEGAAWIHQVWSGDMVSAQYYLPKGVPVEALSYWYPPQGGGVIGSDNIAVLRGAKNPVLAHLFLDWMLDDKNAYSNFVDFVGYQPPMNDIDPDRLVSDGVVPANLRSVVVRPEDFDRGHALLELSPRGDALWHEAYQEFQAGV
jgi:spermidine/putrescine transport system substrate-binding protein